MKFLLFVEGHTEDKALPQFLKRWLDTKLPQSVGIKTVRFEGWPELIKNAPQKARMHLQGPKKDDIIAVISLFPADIQQALPTKIKSPETVNFDEPPAKLLERLYPQYTRRKYKKVTHGRELFGRLDPSLAYGKCRKLEILLDTMLELAKQALQ